MSPSGEAPSQPCTSSSRSTLKRHPSTRCPVSSPYLHARQGSVALGATCGSTLTPREGGPACGASLDYAMRYPAVTTGSPCGSSHKLWYIMTTNMFIEHEGFHVDDWP